MSDDFGKTVRKIRASIRGRSTAIKPKQPAKNSKAEPLIVDVSEDPMFTHTFGAMHTVKFGDYLYYVTLSGDAGPEDIEVRKVKVLVATSKRLQTTSAAGIANTTWESRGKAHGKTPEYMLRTLFAVTRKIALQRYRQQVEREFKSVEIRFQQLTANRTWCAKQLDEIATIESVQRAMAGSL